MQTHTDRRSPSQVKVGHREGAEQGKVQVLTRFFHCAGYFLRYVAYFYRFYVLYAMYHPLLCLCEASCLGHLFRK